ncbi:hypothetical protein C0992_005853, partial [Termitomyces sp. T32_za158]
MGGLAQYADTIQRSMLAHSTLFWTVQPEQGAKRGQNTSSEQTTQHQGASLAMVTGQMEEDKGKVPAAPPVTEKQEESGKEPQVRQKSLGKVLDLESELKSSDKGEDR